MTIGDEAPHHATTMRSVIGRLLAVVALVLASAACGDDDDGPEPVTGVQPGDTVEDPTPDVDVEQQDPLEDPEGADDELVTAVEAYARTVIEGDPEEIVAARSEGCAVLETDLDATTSTAEAIDPDEVEVSDVEAEIDGDEATVSYRLDPQGEQISDERWVREDGEWKWDNC